MFIVQAQQVIVKSFKLKELFKGKLIFRNQILKLKFNQPFPELKPLLVIAFQRI